MKKLLGIALLSLAGITLGTLPLQAADANFTSSNNIDSQMTKSIPGSETAADRQRAATGRLQPRQSGVVTSLVRQGPVMISPVAPAQYGNGEQFLTANPNTAGATTPRATRGEDRDFGGLKLFGWDF